MNGDGTTASNGNGNGNNKKKDDGVTVVTNYVDGKYVDAGVGGGAPCSEWIDVHDPGTGAVVGRVHASDERDVDLAVRAARRAFPKWSGMTVKARAAVMLKFHGLVREHAQELAELIVLENGKNITEALADVAKGNETVEYACSLPQLAQGRLLRVSGGVDCRDERRPLGVVASVVPFNFPFMVPMWTMPLALVMGNCFVLKPSEKVPLTMNRVAQLIEQAGFPDGVFNMVHGTRAAVEALIEHPDVKAVTFVGSSPVAELVATKCRSLNKRCTALGGAKNHLVALDDCDVEQAASDIVVSFAGCAGQRCMAASVLLVVGAQQQELVDKIVEMASLIQVRARRTNLCVSRDVGCVRRASRTNFRNRTPRTLFAAGERTGRDGSRNRLRFLRQDLVVLERRRKQLRRGRNFVGRAQQVVEEGKERRLRRALDRSDRRTAQIPRGQSDARRSLRSRPVGVPVRVVGGSRRHRKLEPVRERRVDLHHGTYFVFLHRYINPERTRRLVATPNFIIVVDSFVFPFLLSKTRRQHPSTETERRQRGLVHVEVPRGDAWSEHRNPGPSRALQLRRTVRDAVEVRRHGHYRRRRDGVLQQPNQSDEQVAAEAEGSGYDVAVVLVGVGGTGFFGGC